jgi:hypothetical protein
MGRLGNLWQACRWLPTPPRTTGRHRIQRRHHYGGGHVTALDPTGRHQLANDRPGDNPVDTVERLRGELIAALSDDLPVYRVLWLLATGMNQTWCLRDLAQADAVDRAIALGFVVAPQEELIVYRSKSRSAWSGHQVGR